MTNFEKIRQMSIDELAKIIICPHDEWDRNCPIKVNCITCCKQYLESEATDENNNNL